MGTRSVVVDDLVMRYGSVEALRGASFSIGAGEIYGLLGPNGAGKTSVLRALTGLRAPTSGHAWVLGHDVAREQRTVRRLIGYVPQALSADGSLTGRENATLFAKLYAVPRGERRTRTDEILDLMGIASAADALVHTYSGGMVRRLEIACALLSAPRVLLLDEPTLGLDPGARRGVWEHLRAQRDKVEMTILVTTHYMEEAQQHCDRVAILNEGAILAEGAPTELRKSLRARATLEDVFISLTGSGLGKPEGGLREVRRARGGGGGGGGGRRLG